jgi:hypothetical protein
MKLVWKTIMIMHNMVVEDEGDVESNSVFWL